MGGRVSFSGNKWEQKDKMPLVEVSLSPVCHFL